MAVDCARLLVPNSMLKASGSCFARQLDLKTSLGHGTLAFSHVVLSSSQPKPMPRYGRVLGLVVPDC